MYVDFSDFLIAALRCGPCGNSRNQKAAQNLNSRYVYANVSDLHREMKTGDAKRKKKHLNEWMPKWASKQDWADSSWDNFAEFGSSAGGGNKAVGATKSVCTDVYNMCNKP